ncbi:Hypothetical protein NGAL_HAMBI2605_57910 [Neorhizobium galegae bv. orientalis]|nr:Hypothetical protein NGAL_HAMBI2605_57910 [Neorhizobium galegae bv. orientalis]
MPFLDFRLKDTDLIRQAADLLYQRCNDVIDELRKISPLGKDTLDQVRYSLEANGCHDTEFRQMCTKGIHKHRSLPNHKGS